MNRRKLKALAYAKINLSLNVSGKTESGLHLLDSVTASVNIADAVTVCERFDSQINITYNGAESRYERDSVAVAIDCLRRRFGAFGLDVAVENNLPEGGGVGGPRADAAAVIALANSLFSFDKRGFDISCAADEVGSDVPVMAVGGYCRLRGFGNRVEKLGGKKLHVVLCTGGGGVSTKECFALFDEMYPSDKYEPSDNGALVRALETGDMSAIAAQCKNALTAPAQKLNGGIKQKTDALMNAGAKAAFMTGSGSGCVGLFESQSAAQSAAQRLNAEAKNAWKAYALDTLETGIKIL